jgi:hypothetical protein
MYKSKVWGQPPRLCLDRSSSVRARWLILPGREAEGPPKSKFKTKGKSGGQECPPHIVL